MARATRGHGEGEGEEGEGTGLRIWMRPWMMLVGGGDWCEKFIWTAMLPLHRKGHSLHRVDSTSIDKLSLNDESPGYRLNISLSDSTMETNKLLWSRRRCPEPKVWVSDILMLPSEPILRVNTSNASNTRAIPSSL
ncbi:hypothetical protein E2P81_ATG03575 [Venturia nashicola]|uniref:Uncharacterized protein n=1 Tax=Venturia nashicola TaxID=86259 RepID=A0A4Z1PBP4_9PEZI|nr:hypothetical protein E6O75_ATG03651 [Venturia nashicola]TLD37900.1 hypothetical protein E2P81_ATG03575 [Venturia nashicola]